MTPIMRRAHQMKEAKEIIFVDSTSACDPLNHSITFVMCPSSAGAVPLAIILTKIQTYECCSKPKARMLSHKHNLE